MHNQKQGDRRQGGFSLAELMVVICIFMVATAIAVPSISRAVANYRLKSASRTLYNHFQKARIEAAKRNADVVIQFTAGTGSAGGYMLFADDGSGTAGNEIQDVGEPTVLIFHAMPDDVTLEGATLTFSNSRSGYTARGLSVNGNGSLTLRNTRGDSYELSMNNIGLISLEKKS